MNNIAINLVKWRWLLAFLSLVMVGLLASGASKISFATDYEVWFSKDNPQFQNFISLQKTYDKSDNVIFILAPKDGNVYTQKTLSSIEWLTKKSWGIPYSTRVDSLSNFQYSYAEGDDLVVTDLFTQGNNLLENEIHKIKQIAFKEPSLIHRIISEDSAVTAVNVTINLPKNNPQGSPTVTAFARELVKELKILNPDLDIYLTGLVVMDNAFMEASMKDMGSLTLIMFGLILFGLLLLLRSISGTLSVIIVIGLSVVATMGFSGLLGVKLTPVSANAPTIIMTIVVANAVHILVTMLQNMRNGLGKHEAMVDSLHVNLQPIMLATVSTVIGFLAMHFSDVPPFHDLGNMVGMGVMLSFFLSIGLLPCLLMLLPMWVKKTENNNNRYMMRLSEFVIRKKHQIFWFITGISIVLFSLIPINIINDNVWEYFDKSVAFRIDTEFASEHLTGPYYLEFSLQSNKSGDINEPQYLKTIEKFSDWLKKQPEVIHVNSISDILKRLNKNMHADNENWYRLPESRELAAQYLLLYEMSLPYGLDLTNQINVDKSSTRVVASLHNLSNNAMIAFHDRSEQWLSEHAANYELRAGSPMFMFSHISIRTVHQMVGGVAFALFLISMLIIFSLRSFKIGLISLIPNLVPPAMAFGVWALLIGEVGFALAVGLGMTIGIIVDDTVHFLSKYLRARREKGLNAEDAVRYAFSTVGSALIITTTVLVAGFSVLAFSTFKSNFDLGLITSLTIGIALAVDFLFLPCLLMMFDTHDYSTEDTVNNTVKPVDQNITLEEI